MYKIWQEEAAFKMDNILEGTRTFDGLEELVEVLLQSEGQLLQFVRFLNHIDAGDKRVLVVDGKIYGGYLRKSSNRHWVHNISAGGTYHAAEVGEAEIRAINKTCSAYQELGLFTLGYDFLMDGDGTWVLSEINAGNIAGYGRVEELSGEPVYERLIAWLVAFSRRG